VYSVKFSPDGRHALSGSADRTVRIWDLERGREARVLEAHAATVWSVAYSPDGRFVASADHSGFVRLWDVTGVEPKARYLPKWHHEAVPSIAFSPDARVLASCGWDGSVILWDVAAAARLREWQLPGPVLAVAFAPDGRHLAFANANGTVYFLRPALPPRNEAPAEMK
jgi:WD40 repeat protein